MQDLASMLAPISRRVSSLDLSDARAAEQELHRSFPPDSEDMRRLAGEVHKAAAEGRICDRGEEGLRYSRVLKPEQDQAGCSVDAVLMEDSAGPPHTHTKGEVCLCLPESGEARFEGRSDPWIVLPPGSRHVPRVEGGRMLILYWWPEGAVKWG